jgi:hypothetical protein
MKSRAYSSQATPHDYDGDTAEVHHEDGRSVQVYFQESGRVLIRMYGPNGTAEYGGNNMTELAMVVDLHEHATIRSINMNGERR